MTIAEWPNSDGIKANKCWLFCAKTFADNHQSTEFPSVRITLSSTCQVLEPKVYTYPIINKYTELMLVVNYTPRDGAKGVRKSVILTSSEMTPIYKVSTTKHASSTRLTKVAG